MSTEGLRAAMAQHGLAYAGPLYPDGRLRRIKVEGDRERNSWYVLHAGPPMAGAFGCWKRQVNETWCERGGKSYSQAEWDATRRRWQEADAQRQREERDRHERARRVAAWLYDRAKPAEATHAYLLAKGVQPHGDLRQIHDGKLVVPLRDAEGVLHSVQLISCDGTKHYLTGGRVQGCFFTLADNPDGPLVLCEGYATGASIHEATGYGVVCAMNCGNLVAVAQALRAKWPEREVIIAADNDAWTDDNPGITKATEAAKAIHARLAVPQFREVSARPTDCNDLHQQQGLTPVKEQIDEAEVPNETDDEIVARLAALPLLDYERQREAAAGKLGCRASILDKLVEAKRPKAPEANGTAQGRAVELPTVEPWPVPVDGAALLDTAACTFARYIVLPDGAADALALWTAHAHCFDAFEHSPRLNLCSPDKGCGKTTALDVLAALAPRAIRTESLTAAVLFRLVEAHKPTLLLDEVDAYLGEAEELRGLLNAGHKRGGQALRCEGENNTLRAFAAFAPAALAGIGELPGTLHVRSVVVPLVRAKPGEVPQRFDSRRTATEAELCRKLARWTADHFERIKACDPKLPETAFNRLADNWRPLFAIAEIAGGDWPARTAKAFAKLVATDDIDAQGIGTVLLADIAGILSGAGTDRLASTKLAESLAQMEGRPWPEWGKARKPISPNQLAIQLRKFRIVPKTVRLGTETAKGYYVADFHEAFDRFLPKNPVPDRNTVTTAVNIDDSALFKPSQSKDVLRPENATKPNSDRRCDGVTVGKPVSCQNGEADLL